MKTKILALTMLLREERFLQNKELQNLRHQLENLSSEISAVEKVTKNDSDSGNAKNVESFIELVNLLLNFLKSLKKKQITSKKTILTDVYDILTEDF